MAKTLFLLFLASLLPLAAQTPAPEAPKPPQPPVKKLPNGDLQLGKITISPKKREIHLPATINDSSDLLEYLLVQEKGKTHEALLLTEASALHLNIALKLLKFPESPQLFEIVDQDYNPTGKFPEVPEATKKAAQLALHVTWQQDGTTKTHPISDLIYHQVLEKKMPPSPWLYTGSYLHEGKFKAEVAGDLIAIYTAQPAIINFLGDDRTNDDVWIVHPKNTPPVGTPVTLILKPFEAKTS